jgi:PAS domain S-box-containing protein
VAKLVNGGYSIELAKTDDLKMALERKEFRLYFQPRLDLMSGKIKGVEALIRWNKPEKGLILPSEFIPQAERTKFIVPIGEWVLRTACAQNKVWQEKGLPHLVMSVNLSVEQLYQPALVESIKKMLKEAGLAPKYLELEITESVLMNVQFTRSILEELGRLGVQISLDDFGTGYSSLRYLRELPINKIKIDQSFIRNCTVNSNDAVIVKSIIALANQLKLEVIAEGVESKEQLIFLQRNFCNEGQGYLFSKPLPPEEFIIKFPEIQRVVLQQDITKETYSQIGSCMDITKRKEIEKRLRESEAKYRMIAENTTDLIMVLDKNGIVEYASSSFEMVLGFQSKEYEGKSIFEMIHPADVSQLKKQYPDLVSMQTSHQLEFRYKHFNGGWVAVEACVNSSLEKNCEVEHIVIIARDITQRKQSEKSSDIGQLVASMTYPLMTIKGYVQLLQEEKQKSFYIAKVLTEIHKLQDIVDRFLSLREKVDFIFLLHEVVASLKIYALLKNIEIILEYDCNLTAVHCDRNQIKLVFIHIFKNAIDAMSNQGIIRIQILPYRPDYIKVRFIDQGCGIPEERMKHIGEPFYSTKEKGIGLGLMTSRGIIQGHGGEMKLESVVNKGTVVTVILPNRIC